MKSSSLPILLVVALLGLLVLLAGLQYNWLGKISDGERERLQKRVRSDAERFAEDFNREMQNAYFTFQMPDEIWRENDWTRFAERFDYWRSKSAYPNLIKNFYFALNKENGTLLQYDFDKREFAAISPSQTLEDLRRKLVTEKDFAPVVKGIPALVMPIHEDGETLNRIIVRTEKSPLPMELPKKFGFLIVELNEEAIKNQILPALTEKYFSGENADFKVAVAEKGDEKIVFQTQERKLDFADAEAGLFSLSPEDFAFFVNRDILSSIKGENKNVVISKKFETKEIVGRSPQIENDNAGNPENPGDKQPRIRVFENRDSETAGGVWTLRVQHADGSLEQFITRTRNRNLAVSFGILSLLAVSVILIFLSAQRAKRLAQRQIDFVSAVSHEFRTPLAVIYSAGENLTDGIVVAPPQIEKYGALIKREGKKLSAMVEQILEFAGARSGKRKYDFRPTNVADIIENALAESQPQLEENNFTVEKNVAENLPLVSADALALSTAIQNLINNSIKYDGGAKWLRVSTTNGDGKIKITIEDKGIGVSAKDLSHVFEPFYRSKQVVNEQIHGNGLGLSLVKHAVEAHGGKVSAESEIGKGSRFTIEIPAGKI